MSRLGGIIELALGGYVMVAVLPGAISAATNVSTTGWDTGVAALWGVVTIVLVASGIMSLLRSVQ